MISKIKLVLASS